MLTGESDAENAANGLYFFYTGGKVGARIANGSDFLWGNPVGEPGEGRDIGMWYENLPNAIRNRNNDSPHIGDKVMLGGWMNGQISIDNRDPARAIRFLNYIFGPEGQFDLFFGEEGVVHEVVDGKPRVFDWIPALDWEVLDRDYAPQMSVWYFWTPHIVETFWEVDTTWQPQTDWIKFTAENIFFRTEFESLTISTIDHEQEAIMQGNISMEWGLTLPRLIRASSDAEFDAILSDYLARRDSLGFESVQAVLLEMVNANRAKLGLNAGSLTR